MSTHTCVADHGVELTSVTGKSVCPAACSAKKGYTRKGRSYTASYALRGKEGGDKIYVKFIDLCLSLFLVVSGPYRKLARLAGQGFLGIKGGLTQGGTMGRSLVLRCVDDLANTSGQLVGSLETNVPRTA